MNNVNVVENNVIENNQVNEEKPCMSQDPEVLIYFILIIKIKFQLPG